MAKNKKRKKTPQPQPRLGFKPSKSYLEASFATARRILRALGEDESLLDTFTKRQRQDIFRFVTMPPYVACMPGHKVPKPFIAYIQYNLTLTMKKNFFDEANEVTLMDVVTVGLSLMMSFGNALQSNTFPPEQAERIERVFNAMDEKKMITDGLDTMLSSVKTSLMSLSQPNFRIYGLAPCIPEMKHNNNPVIHNMMYITTHECQIRHFKYHDKEHIAFRVFFGPIDQTPSMGTSIALSKLFPGIKHDRELDIYIQSHAIHRFKERIDTLHPVVRTQLLFISLIHPSVVRGTDGRLYIACLMLHKSKVKTIGYFAFTIEGDGLFILTFLPLLSYNVPEGHLICERLHLSQDDIKYLGMDKISFFYDVDIEQIPVLKQVLFDELHLDFIHKMYNTELPDGKTFSEKRTAFVKNFFRDIEDRPSIEHSHSSSQSE
ncbi:MAG: hypothetical protein LBF62_00200 [Tannerellaceae bacterium]|jgi:hypothetical protein|nr:hypothetical protein [Tannerellaceae bacterium]